MFHLMTTCTFNYLEQQWTQNVPPPPPPPLYACLTVGYLEETKLKYGTIKTLYG